MPNSSSSSSGSAEWKKLNDLVPVIARHIQELNQPGIVSIRPGYRMENDWPTKEPAIVAIRSKDAPAVSLPAEIEGIKVDVREATAVEQMRYTEPDKFAKLASRRPELNPGAFPETNPPAEGAAALQPMVDLVAAKKPMIPYTAPSVALTPVTGNLSFTCHASPDAGWPTLKSFLSQTQSTLTVGLYDWTSKHILDEVKSVFAKGQQLEITLDNPALNPTADQSDSETVKALAQGLGSSFQSAWALVRQNKDISQWVFPTAYHIKVAVRDNKSVWLSSGNWNNSNQPEIDPIGDPHPGDQETARKSDRDWHVIVDHAGLAQTYEAYLKHDFDVAKGVPPVAGLDLLAALPETMPAEFLLAARDLFQFFPPLRLENELATITPLLTPDSGVYQPAMLELIGKTQEKLYIQLQYIHPSEKDVDADFMMLINAVVEKITAGKDVRIITSQFQISQGWLERLQAAGVDLSKVKIQNGVHNKGFVVDSKIVALGSENWSGDGVLRNRDASVIIENAKAAAYYEKIFLHDWDHIARQSVR
jgi:phosphatidylserine/phosphatidylglycerophosphate/cardiolipin synthase-like enzyme